MNLNRLRPYTAVILAFSFTVLMVTGLILFVAPHGPGSSQWAWIGLTKHQYKDIHLYLGFISIALVLFHVVLNKKPLTKYLAGKNENWGNPVLWAIAVIVAVVSFVVFS
ncbi:DUF4405 domain-containing protein [Neiella marina]|uniref:DUF4405 domain-containing protein n=1 Tax=Neiella holothuriorum TaxID=2870530 RepID=A0ABS7EG73_9GAMM|nr:DUF4405 domain-containing protein [Neiella holothuriorum]MBW8190928.1 DUF4405 domain-containing protein [Neiella holothuriorum]